MSAFPKYPPLPVPADRVKLICAGEPRLVTGEDRVTERRTADGQRQWKVPCMLGVAGENARSEIVQVTVAGGCRWRRSSEGPIGWVRGGRPDLAGWAACGPPRLRVRGGGPW